jgi:hypothetical protein
MVDALTQDLFAKIKAGIPEDDHYIFRLYEKDPAALKDTKDNR